MKKHFCAIMILVLLLTTTSALAEAIFQKGSKGDGVVEIQTLLTEKGYSLGKIDGDFGNATFKAVQAFQSDNGLEVTGIVDRVTYEKLIGWADCEHEYSAWKTTEEPTCTTVGTCMHTCALCGKYEYEDIPALGHNLVSSTNNATKVCSVCGLMDGEIKVGSRVTTEDHAFEVVEAGYTRKIDETIHYSDGGYMSRSEEGSFIAITLKFTNLARESFEWSFSGRATDIKLTYDETYEYDGMAKSFDDIVPLDTGNVYILYTVPELLKDNTDKPLIAEFTIDDEYYVIKI